MKNTMVCLVLLLLSLVGAMVGTGYFYVVGAFDAGSIREADTCLYLQGERRGYGNQNGLIKEMSSNSALKEEILKHCSLEEFDGRYFALKYRFFRFATDTENPEFLTKVPVIALWVFVAILFLLTVFMFKRSRY